MSTALPSRGARSAGRGPTDLRNIGALAFDEHLEETGLDPQDVDLVQRPVVQGELDLRKLQQTADLVQQHGITGGRLDASGLGAEAVRRAGAPVRPSRGGACPPSHPATSMTP